MIITCPKCGKHHKLPEDWSANKVRCARCGEKFFLDELASEFIAPDDSPKAVADDVRAESARRHAGGGATQNPRASKPRLVTSSATTLRFAIGIAAVLVIAGAAAFYFLHVAPENKFRQAIREAEEAENSGRWNDALNAYYRAERIKPRDAGVAGAWQRVEEKRRASEYTEAMARGKAAEQSNNWDTALREYQTALMKKSNDAEAKDSIARVQYQLHMKEGREAEQQKRWEMALIAYSHALAVKRGDVEAMEAEQRVRKLRAENDLKKVALAESTKPVQTNIEAANLSPERKPNLEWNRADALLSSPVGATEEGAAKQRTAQRVLEKSGTDKISVAVIPNVDKDAWMLARKQEAVSGNPSKLYRTLGEQLLAADYLLKDSDLSQRQKGLAIAVQAARGARRLLNDAELASAIADAFLLPNVKGTADEKSYVWLSRSNVIEEAIAAYKLAGDKARQAAAYQMLLEFAPNRNTADFARVRLAELSQQEGNHRRALEYLKAVEPGSGGMSAVRRLIPGIEKKLQLQPNNDGGTP